MAAATVLWGKPLSKGSPMTTQLVIGKTRLSTKTGYNGKAFSNEAYGTVELSASFVRAPTFLWAMTISTCVHCGDNAVDK